MTNKVTMRLLIRVETSLTTETMAMIIAGAIIRTSIMTAIIWVVVSMCITNATKTGHTTKLVVAMISGTTTIMMTTGAITLAAAATPAVATATVVAEVAMVRAASNLTPASKAVVKEAKTVISKCKESTVVSTVAIITIISAIRAATVATKA